MRHRFTAWQPRYGTGSVWTWLGTQAVRWCRRCGMEQETNSVAWVKRNPLRSSCPYLTSEESQKD